MKKPEPSKKEPTRENTPRNGGNHAQSAAPAPAPAPVRESQVNKDDLERFRKLLVNRRQVLTGNVEQMENEALRRNRQDSSGDLSSMPIHIADLGTDNFEQEFTLGLIESEEEEVREIDDAIVRIEQGIFGACEGCSKAIPRDRLRAIPYARFCIECKTKQEAMGE